MKSVNKFGIDIYPERDNNFTEEGLNLLKKFYAADKGESAQVALARTMNNFSYGDKALAQRLTDAASKQWWFPSSPPLSNAVDGEWDTTFTNMRDFWNEENKELRKAAWNGSKPKAMPISCFAAGTPVYTECGIKNIEDIVVGDMVLTHKGRFRKVLATKKSVSNDTYEFQSMMNTTKHQVTGNHLLYTNSGWKRVDELKVGADLVANSCKVEREKNGDIYLETSDTRDSKGIPGAFVAKRVPNFVTVDKELAWALGFWFAEGSTSENGAIRVTHGDEEPCRKWASIFADKFGLNPVVNNSKGQNWFNGEVYSVDLQRNFDAIFGKGCKTKTLPKSWMQVKWEKEVFDAFIEGFYLGDGFKTTDSKIFEITNTRLASQIALKLLENGYRVSSQYRKYIHYNKVKNNGVYNAVVSFSEHNAKRASIRDGVRMNDGLYYCGILSVSKIGKEMEVYDIQVDEDESFSVGGLIAHNCFLTHLGDSIQSQMKASAEIKLLSVMGGGTSLQSRIRATTEVAPGPIPFIKTVDGDMGYWRQGKNRRGSCAVYVDVSHPDIIEFIKMRTPSGGDANRKIVNRSGVHHGVNFTREFAQAVKEDAMFELRCPHSGEVRDKVKARHIWETWLEARELTGEPYFYNIDNANDQLNENQKELGLRNYGSNLCSEITLPNNDERTAICCLSSLNLEKYDEWKDTTLVQDLIQYLDNIIQWFIDWSPEELSRAAFSATKERAIGLGGMGWANLLMKRGIAFESHEAIELNKEIWKRVKQEAKFKSIILANERGEPEDLKDSGMRNSHLLAVAPNANSSILCGTSPSIEPLMSNAYTQKTRAGIMLNKNKFLAELLEKLGQNTEKVWKSIIDRNGSVQHLEFLTKEQKDVFKTAWEIDQHVVVQQAEDRQHFICQSQSLNVFFLPGTDRKYINSVHLKALYSDVLKSMYYFRTGSAVSVENVKEDAQRVALSDWKEDKQDDTECVACQA